MTTATWTEDRVEQLKKLWEAGLSASQIAGELGNITRNAVIGKVHRLGLSGRAKSPSSAAPRQRKARPAQQLMRVSRPVSRGNTALAHAFDVEMEPDPVAYDNVVPMSQRLTLLELNEATCHWPIGDPSSYVRFLAEDPDLATRYRFGSKTTDFIICKRCGVYVGATCETPSGIKGIANLNALKDRGQFTRTPEPMKYDGENAGQKIDRRAARWMSADITF